MERWCKIIEKEGKQYLFMNTNKEGEEAKMTVSTIINGYYASVCERGSSFTEKQFEAFAVPKMIDIFLKTLKQAGMLD